MVNTVHCLRLSLQLIGLFALPKDLKAKYKWLLLYLDTKSIVQIKSRLDARWSIWYLWQFYGSTMHPALGEYIFRAAMFMSSQDINQQLCIPNEVFWCSVNSMLATRGSSDISDGTYVNPRHPSSQIFMIYVCGRKQRKEAERHVSRLHK